MKIVVGLGFGDEGKGHTTSYLCSQYKYKPLVVRFNGGHQAGHTVSYYGQRHVFSSFGSGTLQGVPTFWSKYCTFYPTAVLNEHAALLAHGCTPKLYVHPLCPVTTPYDVLANQLIAGMNRHGSVGVGFGTTLKRQEAFFKLHVQDLPYTTVLRAKLSQIRSYYGSLPILDRYDRSKFDNIDVEEFIRSISSVLQIIQIRNEEIFSEYNLIFEGAQGILLDQNFGFFPNVTPSNTTCQNAIEMIRDLKGSIVAPEEPIEIYYVTRSYQTRHGAGFMSSEKTLALVNNEKETNQSHEFQGNFRTGDLDPELLNYAMRCDSNFTSLLSHHPVKKILVVTCLDQYEIDVNDLLTKLEHKFTHVLVSHKDNYDQFDNFMGPNWKKYSQK